MLAEAVRIANRDGLWQAALDKVAAEEHRANVDRILETVRLNHKSVASRLRTTLAMLLATVDAVDPGHILITSATKNEARAALFAAEPTAEQLASWRAVYGQDAIDLATKENGAN